MCVGCISIDVRHFVVVVDRNTLISWLSIHYVSDKEKQEKNAHTHIHTICLSQTCMHEMLNVEF